MVEENPQGQPSENPADNDDVQETELEIGHRAIEAYSRLSYTMWYALAEFIDNSTQSRINYGGLIDDVLKAEGKPLIVWIDHDRAAKTISIEDNSIGMNKKTLISALKVAQPTKDSHGRSRYGMGLKTAACWIGAKWKIVTTEWDSGEEWTAEVDVEAIAHHNAKIPLTKREADTDSHYTKVVISDLHRNIQKRTEENIRGYLGSMYRYDLLSEQLQIIYNGVPIPPPEELDIDVDLEGKQMRRDIPEGLTIGGKPVTGWVAVLRKGGRKYGGFSLFQNKRQIQGYPNAWKPKSIFGGVDEEGANNLVSQRLTGVIELDGFKVSHTKDSILFDDNEEEDLEKFLYKWTKDYKDYATRRRGPARGQPFSREKVRELLDSLKSEFVTNEMRDAFSTSLLPPITTILANNQALIASLKPEDQIANFEVTKEARVTVWMQEKSEYDPYVTISAGADVGVIHVVINGLHPYYASLDSTDTVDECLRQYIYDAIAEYRASKLTGRVTPDSVRRLKNDLLRVRVVELERRAEAKEDDAFNDINSTPGE